MQTSAASLRLSWSLPEALATAGPPLLFALRLWASVCLALCFAFWLQLDKHSALFVLAPYILRIHGKSEKETGLTSAPISDRASFDQSDAEIDARDAGTGIGDTPHQQSNAESPELDAIDPDRG